MRPSAGVVLGEQPARLPVPPRLHQRRHAGPGRQKNTYVREDSILPHLPTLHARLSATIPPAARRRRRTRAGIEVARPVRVEDVISYLRAREITLTYDPRAATLQADTPDAVTTVISRAS
jgi:hypothetical protein